ncbi:MAG: Gfo/Idh/MocA family oxidoreductase [Candidatus Pacebacteria bacterium]|nr:Gfo/Idh/MocA family oxidoreductase [Candidatus Paceibacterota bacterium]
MSQLRVAVLGQGRSGYDIHCSWLKNDRERFKVVAVADLLPERTAEAQEEFGCRVFGDYRELLADKDLDADVIVNALPSHLHPEGAIAALESSRHVVCEKPLARSVADVDRMTTAADNAGKKLLPFQNSRFQPAFQKILEIVRSGKLGRIIHARINFSGFARRWDWQTRREFWGGNLLNTGPHPMDQAVVLFGEAMPNVFARMVSDNPFGDAENFASVTLWDHNAPTIEVVVSSFMAYPQGQMYNLGGTQGGLTGTPAELQWKYFNPATAPPHEPNGTWSDDRQYCREGLDWSEERWELKASLESFPLLTRAFYTNVYDILVNDAPRIITLDQVRRQIAVMEEAHRQNPDLI